MNTKIKLSDLIERFINNQLNTEELELLKKEMELNEMLRSEIKLEKDLKIIIQREDVLDLRKKINEAIISAKRKKETDNIRYINIKRALLIAACIGFMFLLSKVIYNKISNENDNNSIFSTYYNSDISLNLNRSENNNLAEALISYNQKNYEDAILIFNEILANDSTNIVVAFYAGVSNIEIGNYSNAIKLFDHIIKDQNNLYVEHAEWFKALCYLKLGDKGIAIKEFKKISRDTINYHNREALEILDKIDL